jgi:hypothetical protein
LNPSDDVPRLRLKAVLPVPSARDRGIEHPQALTNTTTFFMMMGGLGKLSDDGDEPEI